MPQIALTEITIRNLKPPERGYALFIDRALAGFGVRITANGAKAYVLTYGRESSRKRVTLGVVSIVPLAKAREKAKNILAEYQLGADAVPSCKTFGDVLPMFLNVHCRQNNKPSTARETERLLTRHFLDAMGSLPLDEITTRSVMEIVDGLADTPAEANHAFTAVKTFLRWCAERGYGPDPLGHTRKPFRAVSRDRVLSEKELASVLAAAKMDSNYGTLIQLLIHTGQRVGQFAPVFTGIVGANTLTWPKDAMKGNAEHIVPLTPRVRGLLSEYVPVRSFSSTKRHFDKLCPISHWTLHDLRRTFSTYHAKLGTSPHIVERILNHTSGTISGVAA